MVRNRCGGSTCAVADRLGDVEPGHELAVYSAGGDEVLVAFIEFAVVARRLFERDDALLKLVDVGGCAESGCTPGLFAEQVGATGVSSCRVRSAMRVQPCRAASRSPRSEARVTGLSGGWVAAA